MDRICIRGGARLKGEIAISGAKNAALPLMAACLLSDKPLVLTNMPWLADIAFMADILRGLGVEANAVPGSRPGEGGRLNLSARNIASTTADYDIVRKMRASFLVLGPLVARMGHAKVSLPGGCAIGARPVDLHLKALEALGAAVELAEGYVIVTARQG
ncbi:MAG: UDP-N-acetylglucosamine 1-carboxyvinyltransferase, partial [Rhizomicrobium sp.]